MQEDNVTVPSTKSGTPNANNPGNRIVSQSNNEVNTNNSNSRAKSFDNNPNVNSSDNKASMDTPSLFPFDMSSWEDTPEMNFMMDPHHASVDSPSIISSVVSPMNNLNQLGGLNLQSMTNISGLNMNGIQGFNNMSNMGTMPVLSNVNSMNKMGSLNHLNNLINLNIQQQQQQQQQHKNAQEQSKKLTEVSGPSIDYSAQLQHYQNLLLETQGLLNMKQQMQQKSPGSNAGTPQPNTPQSVNTASYNNSQQNMIQQLLQLAQMQQNLQQSQPQIPLQQQINQNLASSISAAFQSGVPNLPQDVNALQSYITQFSNLQQHQLFPQQQLQLNAQSTQPPIKFSPNDGRLEAPSKLKKKAEVPQPRTKIRPCDHCRRRKIKCVMIPDLRSCKSCQQKGIKCTFNENTTVKRNIQPLEQDNKRMKFEDPTIEPPPNVLVRDVPPIKDYSKMQGDSLLKKTLSLQFPRSSFYIGPTSIYDPLFLDKVSLDKIDQLQINKTRSIRKVSNNIQFMLRDDFSEMLYEQSEKDSDTVEKYVAPHGQILIDLYFKMVHPSFPVLHKKIFLEKYSRTHREFGASLLAAVYLLAIQWWDYEPRLAKFPKPDVLSLHRFAIRTFADIIQRPKLSAVQAGLLLLQCQSLASSNLLSMKDKQNKKTQIDQRTKEERDKHILETQLQLYNQNNWLLCTQVVGLAEELGLGLDCSHWRLPKWERGLRRRLAWAVYSQDKWSSLVESRPSHISDQTNWLVKPLTDDDFPEKTNDMANNNSSEFPGVDVELGKESFKHGILLSVILSEILSSLYTPRAIAECNSINTVLKIAKPLQLKLREWYHSLPKYLQMGASGSGKFNVNGNLQLSYFATEILLHRRIISTLYNQTRSSQAFSPASASNNSTPSAFSEPQSSSQSQQPSTIPPPPPQLIAVCRNAAKTRLTASIGFVRELDSSHMQSFWHSSASRNFASIGVFAVLLYVTSLDADEASIYREHIMDYRWILKANAETFGIAKEALRLIDGVIKNIPGLWNEYDDVSMDAVSKNVNFEQSNLNLHKRTVSNNNYGANSGDSPQSMASPKQANSKTTNTIGRVSQNATPLNSPVPPSPLSGRMNFENSKNVNKQRTKSPIMNRSLKPGKSSGDPKSATSPERTPIVRTPTPVLRSQSMASTPNQNAQGRISKDSNNSVEKQGKEDMEKREASVKEKAQELFRVDNKDSIMNMKEALDISGSSEHRSSVDRTTNNDGEKVTAAQHRSSGDGSQANEDNSSNTGKLNLAMLTQMQMQKLLGMGNENGTH